MIVLRTLGAVTLEGPAVSGRRRIELQPKRLALLVYLARRSVAAPVRRDELLALFWPEADESRARGVLRQALTDLRKHLGADVVVTHGDDDVALDPHLLSCDANRFEAACRARDHACAAELYGGDFLAGFHASGVAAEFELWVDAERSRLRRAAVEAATAVASGYEATGRAEDAVHWARRAVEIEPLHEPAVVRLMRLLDGAGDRAGALAEYGGLERRLRQQLDIEPGPESRAAMRAIRDRSTPRPAAVAAISLAAEPPTPATEPSPAPAAAVVEASTAESAGRPSRTLTTIVIAAALVLVVTVLALAREKPAVGAPEPNTVAVAPFRVNADDASLAWLRDGLPELLSMRLAGRGAIRVVHPGRGRPSRTVEGTVAGTRDRLLVTAWLVDPATGRGSTPATVEGNGTEIPALVERLAASLLGRVVAPDAGRLASLEGVPLEAVQAFVAGRAAMERGRTDEAIARFREAVDVDSTFALAAMEMSRAGIWVAASGPDIDRGIRLATAHRDRLGPADRVLLDVFLSSFRTFDEQLAAQNAAVTANPQRPEMWYMLGDLYYHWGRLAGLPDAHERAAWAFRQGWVLDSVARGSTAAAPFVAEPMEHMLELEHERGDTATLRGLVRTVLAADSGSQVARLARWHLAEITGAEARRAFWASFGDASQHTSKTITLFIRWSGVGGEDMDVAVAEDQRRLAAHDPGFARLARTLTAYNAGRPSEMVARKPSIGWLYQIEGGWWDGDSATTVRAAEQLERYLVARGDSLERGESDAAGCLLGLWHARRNEIAAATAALRRVEHGTDGPAELVSYRNVCGAVIRAGLAAAQGRTDAPRLTALADSLARSEVFGFNARPSLAPVNLVLAELWERQGDLPRALRAVQRRGRARGFAPNLMTTFLQEEGRLALLLGDTATAVRAWRHYLAFRTNPEPSVRPAVEHVRQALAALEFAHASR